MLTNQIETGFVCVFYFTQRGSEVIYVDHSSQQQSEREHRDLSVLKVNIWHVCISVNIHTHM